MAVNIETAEWRPGSFTKNFSWGPPNAGLAQLHESIRIGFDGKLEDVSREAFRKRVRHLQRPEYIPINFFLFNKVVQGKSMLVADELVFQSVAVDHSSHFDKLALFAFNLSYSGVWNGATPHQRRPALWAFHYVRDRVASQLQWQAQAITADDIERFVQSDPRYVAEGSRKLATNLNYLYQIGRIGEYSTPRIERWWVDALFLTLDRLIEDRSLDGSVTPKSLLTSLLLQSGFEQLSGPANLAKGLAIRHLITLYDECGGRNRFSYEDVRDRTLVRLHDVELDFPNDPDCPPQGAVHPTNPQILKSIPRVCAMLAKYAAGFEIIDAEDLVTFEPEEFIKRRTRRALAHLRERNIAPTMSAEDLMRITRER